MSSSAFASDSPEQLLKITYLTNLPSVIFATTGFIVVWSWIKAYVTSNGRLEGARAVISVNSKIYAVFSLALAIGIARSVLLGEEGNELGEWCKYIYHFSKFYEYLDVFFLVANGIVIGKHMAFHHITTPVYTYFRVLNASQWQVFAFLNCFHHFLMYGYFGGANFLRPVLPYTGYLQLAGGIALDAWYFIQQGTADKEESTCRAVGLLLLLRYAQLFTEELKSGSQQKSTSATQVGSKKDR